MDHRTVLGGNRPSAVWLIAPALLLLVLGFSAPVPAGAASRVLDAEPLLLQYVDLSVKDEPLVDVISHVGRLTGAPLAVSSDVADEPVTVFVRHRSARELLSLLADHLDYSWSRQERGGLVKLVLVQNLAAKRREQALRAAHDAAAGLRRMLEEEVRLDARPEIRVFARLSPEKRRERLEELIEQRDGKLVVTRDGNSTSYNRVRSGPRLPKQERDSLTEQIRLLLHAAPECYSSFSGQDACGRLYGVLSPEGRQALWGGAELRFGYPADPRSISISAETAAQIAAGGLGNLQHHDDEVTGRDIPTPFHSVERLRAVLTLEGSGVDTRLHIRVHTVGSFGEGEQNCRVEWSFQEDVRDERHYQAPVGPYLDDAAGALRDPITVAVPDHGKMPGVANEPADAYFPDVLERLAAHVQEPIIADGYTRGGLVGGFTEQRAPAAKVLERICKIFSCVCRKERGYLLFRHRDWAVARAVEPPARSVRRWQRAVQRDGALPFAALLEIGGLTPGQTEMLQVRMVPVMPDSVYELLRSDIQQSGRMLRLLHLLPVNLRASLEAGNPVPFKALPQRSLRPLHEMVDDMVDAVRGYEKLDLPGVPPFKPGQGFELEERLEGALGRGTLSLRRTPARWGYTKEGLIYPKELLAEFGEALPPRSVQVPDDARYIDGELIRVYLQIPGVEPIRHFFLLGPQAQKGT